MHKKSKIVDLITLLDSTRVKTGLVRKLYNRNKEKNLFIYDWGTERGKVFIPVYRVSYLPDKNGGWKIALVTPLLTDLDFIEK